MTIQFSPTDGLAARPWLSNYWQTLASPIDSFLEDRILRANLYEIRFDGAVAGLAAVYGESTLTLLHLAPEFQRHSQPIFAAACRLESVREALVASGDEHFLTLVLESARRVEPAAYFFQQLPGDVVVTPAGYALRPAGAADEALIRQHSDDFFEPLAPALARGDLFLGYQAGALVAIGVAERGRLAPDHASIGMFVLAERRRQSHGTATIQALMAHCRATGLTPIAGCYYYNHNSKKTLEKAGMYSKTRLFKAQL
jgi:GNAT superfamily N-acetyltransferase